MYLFVSNHSESFKKKKYYLTDPLKNIYYEKNPVFLNQKTINIIQ